MYSRAILGGLNYSVAVDNVGGGVRSMGAGGPGGGDTGYRVPVTTARIDLLYRSSCAGLPFLSHYCVRKFIPLTRVSRTRAHIRSYVQFSMCALDYVIGVVCVCRSECYILSTQHFRQRFPLQFTVGLKPTRSDVITHF